MRTSLLYEALVAHIGAGARSMEAIPSGRRDKLGGIARYVKERIAGGGDARLTFICTHNSRRSHMAQIWAQALAFHFGIERVYAFSGGTEATAFNPRAVAALRRCGFRIDKTGESENPTYHVRYSDNGPVIEAFSKVFDSPPNPRDGFCAVMTCSDADANCPFVAGASERVSIPYDDPKDFDGTGREALEYDERCRKISGEMMYLFSLVAGQ
jgi:hypothetical protein